MAEVSTLIDRHFLECVICSEPFNDPRALPCLHPFCCECLEHWAKSCSNDNSIVSCPLCKKVYQIPEEEGIKGFPVHFLVTNLQDNVDRAKQKKSTTGLCNKHGQEKKYYCVNCGCAACSDCCVLDPSHRSHLFIQLKEASKQRTSSLDKLTRRVKDVEEKFTTAIQQIQEVEQDLERATDEKIQAIDEAKNAFMQQVDKLVEAYKQGAYSKKEENRRAIDQIKEKLQVDLASLINSTELANNVIESGSDSDIISLYPSLSSSLQQLAESQPTPVNGDLGEFKLDPPQPTSMDLHSLEQLLCDKLHITIVPTEHTLSHQTSNLSTNPSAVAKPLPSATAQLLRSPAVEKPVSSATTKLLSSPAAEKPLPSATAQLLPSPVAANSLPSSATEPLSDITPKAQVIAAAVSRQLKSTGKTESSQGQSLVSSPQSSTQPCMGKKWKYWANIKMTPQASRPMGIAIHPDGDIVLTSMSSPVTVLSRNGDFKHIFKGSPSEIFDLAITPSNQYIIPGKPGKNEFYIYDSQNVLFSTTPTYDINKQPSNPTSVAVDSAGRIIVGFGYNGHKTVSIHQPDGSLISKFETTSPPRRLTCTPDDKLIISFHINDTLQLMDQSGHNASIIEPPPGIQSWKPCYVCCSKQGELFVGNTGYPKAVYRYVCTGGEYKYLDCITKMENIPWGIALSADEQELFLVDWKSSLVKIFQ
ncbi:uncharacterized protein [Amphiura filiformis]|uniref:uncharacterized protein n=1 Tax=Amphiura filiformis TaxID=82378 RepID=UPI003B20D404